MYLSHIIKNKNEFTNYSIFKVLTKSVSIFKKLFIKLESVLQETLTRCEISSEILYNKLVLLTIQAFLYSQIERWVRTRDKKEIIGVRSMLTIYTVYIRIYPFLKCKKSAFYSHGAFYLLQFIQKYI